MKLRTKIVLFSICLVLSLPWLSTSISCFSPLSIEKKFADKKEALPENELDSEEKTFELVPDFLPSPTTLFQVTFASNTLFSRRVTIPKSIIFGITNPPPERQLVA